jgi:predicted enzyme related to lactoylglutathione lyase
MTDVIEGMEAVTVHIRDIQRARKFYSEVLGLKEISYIAAASRAAYAIPGTTTLLTMHVQGEGEGGREPGTVSGVVFSHHDPKAALEEVRKRGGSVVDEPRTYPTPLGTVTLGVFSDPDGNQFVLRHVEKGP